MIFKIIIIGGGLYMLYRMFIQQPQISGSNKNQPLDHQPGSDDEYVDYEEVD